MTSLREFVVVATVTCSSFDVVGLVSFVDDSVGAGLFFSAAAMAAGGFTAVNNPFGIGFFKADAPPGGATGRMVVGMLLPLPPAAAAAAAAESPCRGAC